MLYMLLQKLIKEENMDGKMKGKETRKQDVWIEEAQNR